MIQSNSSRNVVRLLSSSIHTRRVINIQLDKTHRLNYADVFPARLLSALNKRLFIAADSYYKFFFFAPLCNRWFSCVHGPFQVLRSHCFIPRLDPCVFQIRRGKRSSDFPIAKSGREKKRAMTRQHRRMMQRKHLIAADLA